MELQLTIVIYILSSLLWTAALVGFYYVWPYIRHRRAYVVVMATLCLGSYSMVIGATIVVVAYPSIPLAISIPIQVFFQGYLLLPEALAASLPVGALAWALWGKYVKPLDYARHSQRAKVSLAKIAFCILSFLVCAAVLLILYAVWSTLHPYPYRLAMTFIVWSVPLIVFYFALPLLERRRIYIAMALALCLTPSFGHFQSIDFLGSWPIVIGFPYTYFEWGHFPTNWLLFTLLAGVPIGVMIWLFLRRLEREAQESSGEA